MTYHYQLNAGQYVLMQGDTPVGSLLDEVALALDRESGTLHKHGSAESVSAWLTQARAKFQAVGYRDLANNLVMVCGKFPLDELNRCLSTTGYVGVLYGKLLAGQVAQEAATLPTPRDNLPG